MVVEKENGNFKKRGVDYEVKEQMFTLPPRYYQSSAIFSEELERIFYKKWFLAGRMEEIPDTGSYITIPVGEESIILVRESQNHIKAFFNVCRHRGTQLCDQKEGVFANGRIKCPYHAWQYDLSGKLRGAPLMHDVSDFNKNEYDLYEAHVKLWGGFIFLNLDENPVSFEEDLNALLGRFENWNLEELRIAYVFNYRLNCNWKLIIQNYQECYHCPGVHPMLADWTPFRGAVHDCMEGSVIGGYMEYANGVEGMTMDGKAAAPPVCNVSGSDLKRVHYYSIFPNMLLSPHPDFVMYHRLRPRAVDETVNDCFFLLHPKTIEDKVKMDRFQSALEFWDMTNQQDWHVCEQMQIGLRSKRFKKGIYSNQEDILYAIDKEVLKSLGHTELLK